MVLTFLQQPRTKALLEVSRLDKPVGTLLLLWPTVTALWIAAGGWPGWHLVFVFVFGTFLTRSAGCIVNDVSDRNFDPLVKRTRSRPFAEGRLAIKDALTLMAVFLLLALALVLTTNLPTLLLSAAAVLFAGIYPLMKRFTHLPQVILGIAFSFGIPMAFTATTGTLNETAGLLFLANLVWVVAYDTEYAMVDRDDDLLIGVKSTAILFGDLDRFMIGVLQGLFVSLLWLVGHQAGFSDFYHGFIGLITCLLVYQQWLIRDRSRDGCFRAFRHNQWVGGVLFLSVLVELVVLD